VVVVAVLVVVVAVLVVVVAATVAAAATVVVAPLSVVDPSPVQEVTKQLTAATTANRPTDLLIPRRP
jgi:hypothetical protein